MYIYDIECYIVENRLLIYRGIDSGVQYRDLFNCIEFM